MHCHSDPSPCANTRIYAATQQAVSRKLSSWKLPQEKEIKIHRTSFPPLNWINLLFLFSRRPLVWVTAHICKQMAGTIRHWIISFPSVSTFIYNISSSRRDSKACSANTTLDTISSKWSVCFSQCNSGSFRLPVFFTHSSHNPSFTHLLHIHENAWIVTAMSKSIHKTICYFKRGLAILSVSLCKNKLLNLNL